MPFSYEPRRGPPIGWFSVTPSARRIFPVRQPYQGGEGDSTDSMSDNEARMNPQLNGGAVLNGGPHLDREPQLNRGPQVDGEPELNERRELNGNRQLNGGSQLNGAPEPNGRPELHGDRQRNGEPQLNGAAEVNEGLELNDGPHLRGASHLNGEPRSNGLLSSQFNVGRLPPLNGGLTQQLHTSHSPQRNGGPFSPLNGEVAPQRNGEAFPQRNRESSQPVNGGYNTATTISYDFDLGRAAAELAYLVLEQLNAGIRDSYLDGTSMEAPLSPLPAPFELPIPSSGSTRRNSSLDPSDSLLRPPRNTALIRPVTLPNEEQDALLGRFTVSSEETPMLLQWFISSRGNEYFCEIDEEYLTDRFNLTGLNTEVQYYNYALDLITDVFDIDCDDEMREQVERSARILYGLVHARYIITTRGLAKMVEKYKKGDFGKCPRVLCQAQPLLPTGQHDTPAISTVKLYCPRCEDIYNPKSSRHASIDGAYFGSSFHNILFQVYPSMMPPKSSKRYEPRIYGFRVHAAAALARWQEERRQEAVQRLNKAGVETGFDAEEGEEDGEEEEDAEPEEGIDDMFEGQGMAQIA